MRTRPDAVGEFSRSPLTHLAGAQYIGLVTAGLPVTVKMEACYEA